MDNGWIKLHRRVLKNPIYRKSAWFHLWVHLLLLANHNDEYGFIWNGKPIHLKPGQFITGRKALSEETGIPQTTIERILNYLENEHQIGQQKTTKYRLITIVKWKEYQNTDSKTDNRRTTDGHIQEDNNIRRITQEMYKYEQIDNEGNPLKRVTSKIDKKTNEMLISVGLMWRDMASEKLSIPKRDVIMLNLYYPIRKTYDREKWTKEDYKALFTYFFNDEKIKYEDKLSFDLCLSQKYIAKYKLNQKKRSNNQTNVSISSEIRL